MTLTGQRILFGNTYYPQLELVRAIKRPYTQAFYHCFTDALTIETSWSTDSKHTYTEPKSAYNGTSKFSYS